ncbi:hypothetical Protein YC6258_02053 [Gynuella sunshinyii YC6258]|uniref:Uncharacterized protein n=1 Tax=Gynuella sunshinyii YC6258 TaxID=1445510 RepID=A0A0C5VHF2_9GAMM|nr:hypothetical Protein YC6258_02053 [Gynuella sunshinyii YC6258]
MWVKNEGEIYAHIFSESTLCLRITSDNFFNDSLPGKK